MLGVTALMSGHALEWMDAVIINVGFDDRIVCMYWSIEDAVEMKTEQPRCTTSLCC